MENVLRPFDDRPARSFVAAAPDVFERRLSVGASDSVDIGYESANPALQHALWPDAVYSLLNRLDQR